MQKIIEVLKDKVTDILLAAMTIVVIILVVLSSTKHVKAQTAPSVYWQFNSPSNLTANVGGNVITYGAPYTIGTGGPVGNYFTQPFQQVISTAGTVNANTAMSFQLLFRMGRDFPKSRKAYIFATDNMWIILEYPYIIIHTPSNDAYFTMNQTGKASWSAINDGNWHHMAVTYTTVGTNNVRLYIDGQNPAYFVATAPGNALGGSQTIWFASTLIDNYCGDLDEVAVYPNVALSANQIWQNYLDYTNGLHYSTALAASVPAATPTTAGYNTLEYAPNATIGACPTPIQTQFSTFPRPRLKPQANTTDSLCTILTFIGIDYLGGLGMPYSGTPESVIRNGVQANLIMAKDFNFAINMGPMGGYNPAYAVDTNVWQGKAIKHANLNPQWKLQMSPLFGGDPWTSSVPNTYDTITTQKYQASYYLQNGSGQFYNEYTKGWGNVPPNMKMGRPSITRAQSLLPNHFPDTVTDKSFSWDSLAARVVNNALTRPLDFAIENGELFKRYTDAAMQSDPVIGPEITASGYTPIKFQSLGRSRIEQKYRDAMFNNGALAQMSAVKYAEYQIQGALGDFHEFAEMKFVNFLWRGQYMSTADFYPRKPFDWWKEGGAFHGYNWLENCDSSEQANGTTLQCTFVWSGNDINPTISTAPAQYLGMMKVLGVRGSESYYASTFPGDQGQPLADPRNYGWSIITPSYAQAITSRFERILHHGYLMRGDLSLSRASAPLTNACAFNTGRFDSYCVVRKDSSANKYVIGSNLNRLTNMVGSCPDSTISMITLNGENITFTTRQHGSVYVYDNSTPSAKVFYQLDKWHEKTHPYYWSTDFEFEAEVSDNLTTPQLKTYLASGAPLGNYVNSTTCISYADTTTVLDSILFNFTPRVAVVDTFYIWIRMRSRNGSATGVTFKLNNGTTYTLPVTNTGWYWYRYTNGVVLAPGINYALTAVDQHLGILPINKYVEIDQVVFTKTPNAGYPEVLGPCVATSTITPSGAITFCAGGTVNLVANANIAYLWSNGATTQSVTVTTTGTYTVTVTDGSGCTGVSAPVTVTANPNPTTPIISAGGSTTFCVGGSVTLTSTAATSYLWSTGATTQAISATTAGNYTVTVTNGSGCTASSAATTITTNALPAVPTITAGGATTFCSGGSVSLTSSAATTYQWSTGAITSAITATLAGSYTVTVTNAAGCSRSSATTTVTVDGIPIIAPLPPVQNTCPAVDFDLSTLTLVNTGTAITVISYHATLADAQNDVAPIAAVVVATAVYYIRGETAAGCYAVVSQSVQITACACVSSPTANAGANQTVCKGVTVSLSGSRTVATTSRWTTSGTGTFTPNNTTLTPVYNPSPADTVAGTVTITLTTDSVTGAPCVGAVDAMIITMIAAPTAVVTASGAVTFCQGGSVNLNVTAATSYLWSTGQTTQAITTSTAGSYKCTVTNSSGCTSGGSNVITVVVNATPAIPVITAGGPTTFCNGGSVTLTAASATTYLWSTGATTQAITPTTAGSYVVTVANASGCTRVSLPKVVIVNAVPATPVITPGGSSAICQGNIIILSSSTADSYVWTGGSTSSTLSVSTAGTYNVTITTNGCTAVSANKVITVNPTPTVTVTNSGTTQLCYGTTVTLTSSSATSYVWNTGEITQAITVDTTGVYYVIVTDGSGCSAISTPLLITVMPQINTTITPSGATTFCQPNTINIDAQPGYSYLWSNGITTQSVVAGVSLSYAVLLTDAAGCTAIGGPIIVTAYSRPSIPVILPVSPISICSGQTVLLSTTTFAGYNWSNGATSSSTLIGAAGTYTVTVSNINGCTRESAPTIVSSGSSIKPIITASGSTTICQGASLTLSSTAATGYLWSTGATTQSISPIISGVYVVTTTDAFGCTAASLSKKVTINPLPVATVTASGPTSICVGGAVQLTVSSSTSYLWSNGLTTRSVTITAAGSYTVTITNSKGCTGVSSATAVTINTADTCNCGIPFGMNVTNIRPYQATIIWDFSNVNTGYIVYVQKAGLPASRRVTTCTQEKRFAVYTGLRPGTNYQYWMRGICSGVLTDSVPAKTFKTLSQ